MKLKSRMISACIALSVAFGPGASLACSMPDRLIIEQTSLNITYPDATFVTGATWKMQQEGLLDMPDRERITATGDRRAELDGAALFAAMEALRSLGAALHDESRQRHRVSVVLVERVHWERFLPDPAKRYNPVETRCFIPCNPLKERADDLVVVTSEPTLHAIRKGVLPISEAVTLGVMRLYGTEKQISAFVKDFGEVGARPLETHLRSGFIPQDPLSSHIESSYQQAPKELLTSR